MGLKICQIMTKIYKKNFHAIKIQRCINLFFHNEIKVNQLLLHFFSKKNGLWIYLCNLESFGSLIYDKDEVWSCRKIWVSVWMNCAFYLVDQLEMWNSTIGEETERGYFHKRKEARYQFVKNREKEDEPWYNNIKFCYFFAPSLTKRKLFHHVSCLRLNRHRIWEDI